MVIFVATYTLRRTLLDEADYPMAIVPDWEERLITNWIPERVLTRSKK